MWNASVGCQLQGNEVGSNDANLQRLLVQYGGVEVSEEQSALRAR